jgi:hypothetical protein
MKTKTLIVLSVLAMPAFAEDRPEAPTGVFTCSGQTRVRYKGEIDRSLNLAYSSTVYFPVEKKPKYSFRSASPSYVSNGSYWWWYDPKYSPLYELHLETKAPPQIYRKIAISACKELGLKCTATTTSNFAYVKIVDDSHLELHVANTTNVKASTKNGPVKFDIWTTSTAPCLKN